MGNDKLEKYEALDFINGHIIEGLEKKIILQNKMLVDARAENERLNDKDGLYDEVKELQAEIRQLKADAKHDADVWYDVDDEHIAEIKALKEQVSDLMLDKEELQDGVSRLMNQVSSNNGNSSSTHTHTISGEIAEYMSHNEGCMGARMFLIPRDEFNDGEYDNTIYWDDGIE